MPARVVLPGLHGVPCVVDLAAMRDGMRRWAVIRVDHPLIPVDLVIDHSAGRPVAADALARNVDIEFERNRERYEFLQWGQQAFDNFRVVPPNTESCIRSTWYLARGLVRKIHMTRWPCRTRWSVPIRTPP